MRKRRIYLVLILNPNDRELLERLKRQLMERQQHTGGNHALPQTDRN